MKRTHGILGKSGPLYRPNVYLFFGKEVVEKEYSTIPLVSAAFITLSAGMPSSAIYAGFDLVCFGNI